MSSMLRMQNPEDWASHAEEPEQDGKMEKVRAAEMDWIQVRRPREAVVTTTFVVMFSGKEQ